MRCRVVRQQPSPSHLKYLLRSDKPLIAVCLSGNKPFSAVRACITGQHRNAPQNCLR